MAAIKDSASLTMQEFVNVHTDVFQTALPPLPEPLAAPPPIPEKRVPKRKFPFVGDDDDDNAVERALIKSIKASRTAPPEATPASKEKVRTFAAPELTQTTQEYVRPAALPEMPPELEPFGAESVFHVPIGPNLSVRMHFPTLMAAIDVFKFKTNLVITLCDVFCPKQHAAFSEQNVTCFSRPIVDRASVCVEGNLFLYKQALKQNLTYLSNLFESLRSGLYEGCDSVQAPSRWLDQFQGYYGVVFETMNKALNFIGANGLTPLDHGLMLFMQHVLFAAIKVTKKPENIPICRVAMEKLYRHPEHRMFMLQGCTMSKKREDNVLGERV